jgi:hypothetical protein
MAYQVPPTDAGNGLATAGMVLGIVAFPMSLLYCVPGFVPAILAIIFGFIARARVRRGQTSLGAGMAMAGIILGFSQIAISLIFFTIIAIAIATDGFK